MLISIPFQINIIIFSFLGGFATGVLFDIYRVIRGVIFVNKIVTFIEDLLFWIFASLVIFIFLNITNSGNVGIYIYMYIIFGLFVYIKLMSKHFILFIRKISNIIFVILCRVKNIVFYPFEVLNFIINSKNKKNSLKKDKNKIKI